VPAKGKWHSPHLRAIWGMIHLRVIKHCQNKLWKQELSVDWSALEAPPYIHITMTKTQRPELQKLVISCIPLSHGRFFGLHAESAHWRLGRLKWCSLHDTVENQPTYCKYQICFSVCQSLSQMGGFSKPLRRHVFGMCWKTESKLQPIFSPTGLVQLDTWGPGGLL
jgi:hypothetical protein